MSGGHVLSRLTPAAAVLSWQCRMGCSAQLCSTSCLADIRESRGSHTAYAQIPETPQFPAELRLPSVMQPRQRCVYGSVETVGRFPEVQAYGVCFRQPAAETAGWTFLTTSGSLHHGEMGRPRARCQGDSPRRTVPAIWARSNCSRPLSRQLPRGLLRNGLITPLIIRGLHQSMGKIPPRR